jgi:predicted transcriptional regulator
LGRLQEIKEDWLQEKETYQFRQLAIEPEDIDWLIEQAEKVERYEKENEKLREELTKYVILYANEKGLVKFE